MAYRMIKLDPLLAPFEKDIKLRMDRFKQKKNQLLASGKTLSDFANGYEYFGFHRTKNGWVYREWAPAAEKMALTGDFNNWSINSHPMQKISDDGIFELYLEGSDALQIGEKVQALIWHNGEMLRRIPLYATRVVQDPSTTLFCAEIEDTFASYPWTDQNFKSEEPLFIYECHIGMAQEEGKVGSYREFIDKILPRIQKLGYNTIQVMAIMEHPYYGSFGYQVSNFYAPSSRYGTGRELKELINTAHEMGIAVLLDVVHSHAVKNTNEGLNEFDGTVHQFFHEGARGDHSAWGTKLFNYDKNEVLHFLLSNLKYWMEIFHFDGFRFDGVTSMLYHNHGLGSAFTDYSMYFSLNTDLEAVTYLQLANELIHSLKKDAITIAEDMSGMPGMCLSIPAGGIGFDYRLSMGIPDLWIKTVKERRDEEWDLHQFWYELCSRRPGEKNIGYTESHDQALVGDKTLIFRLCDANMYTGMENNSQDPIIDRGMALHKMIRLLTATVAGEGYLNFMGNEFGHPEWIDFPREGNGWSYHYCRRQWSLADNENLRYQFLQAFDERMIALLKSERLLKKEPIHLFTDQEKKILLYSKGKILFAFNFHHSDSYNQLFIPLEKGKRCKVLFSTDDFDLGGFGRIHHMDYKENGIKDGRTGFLTYLPARSAVVFKIK